MLSFAARAQSATVIAENAKLRGTPSERGKVVSVLEQDTSVEVIKQRSAWFLVQSTDYVGWLHGNTIRLTSSSVDKLNESLTTTPRQISPSKNYIRRPRGGCYYLSGTGRKVYVDRSLCE